MKFCSVLPTKCDLLDKCNLLNNKINLLISKCNLPLPAKIFSTVLESGLVHENMTRVSILNSESNFDAPNGISLWCEEVTNHPVYLFAFQLYNLLPKNLQYQKLNAEAILIFWLFNIRMDWWKWYKSSENCSFKQFVFHFKNEFIAFGNKISQIADELFITADYLSTF